jgi:poly-gamma-glutamate synthesis protein (capsule biosynthesis protein)
MDRIRRNFIAAAGIALISILLGSAAVVEAHLILRSASSVASAPSMQDGSGALSATLPSAGVRTPSVTLFVAGDVMLDRTVADRIRRAGDDAYPFALVRADERFTSPDLRLVNLEGPFTANAAAPEKTIDFHFAPRLAATLRSIGIDVASQANNHALDQGRAGAEESRRVLAAAGLAFFGDEIHDDDIALTTMTVNNRRIAFVGFNETSDRLDENVAEETMRKANRSADTIIVFMHWGEEYRHRPTRSQESRARWLIDHGADAVIGAHPHWVQGISSYRGRPIIYSLGNFVFDQDWSVETRRGLTLGMRIDDAGVGLSLYPVQIDLSQPRFVEGEDRDARLRDLASVSDAALLSQILKGEVFFPPEN